MFWKIFISNFYKDITRRINSFSDRHFWVRLETRGRTIFGLSSFGGVAFEVFSTGLTNKVSHIYYSTI
jgi:hypothetical protein